MRGEDSANVGTRPMDFLDQVRDPRSHHQQVPGFARTRIPVRVRRSPSSKHRRPGAGLEFVAADPEAKRSFEHIPRLVVLVMDVKGRDPLVADLGRPLDDDEAFVDGPDRIAEERLNLQGSDYRDFATCAGGRVEGCGAEYAPATWAA